MVFKPVTEHFRNAKKIGVSIKPSKVKGKKLDVFLEGEKVASIGDTKYMDYQSYKEEKGLDFANNRRRLYRIRHGSDMNKVGTPSYFASKILW